MLGSVFVVTNIFGLIRPYYLLSHLRECFRIDLTGSIALAQYV